MKGKKIFSIFFTIVVVLVLLADVALVLAPRLSGQTCLAVGGGSMEPTIRKGDLVFVRPVELAQIQPGDVLTFQDKKGNSFFTHRVMTVDRATGILTTKGDANQFEDPAPASYDYVVGKVVKTVPGLGWVHLCLRSPYGIAAVLALLVLWLGFEIYFVRKRKHEKA